MAVNGYIYRLCNNGFVSIHSTSGAWQAIVDVATHCGGPSGIVTGLGLPSTHDTSCCNLTSFHSQQATSTSQRAQTRAGWLSLTTMPRFTLSSWTRYDSFSRERERGGWRGREKTKRERETERQKGKYTRTVCDDQDGGALCWSDLSFLFLVLCSPSRPLPLCLSRQFRR